MPPFSIKPSQFSQDPDLVPTVPILVPRIWSPLQRDIFSFIKSGHGSAVVIAVAGSGKTTTIVEAAKLLPSYSSHSTTFVAFNKSIAEELKTRLPGHVRAQTLNAMGFGAWRRYLGDKANALKLDANKVRTITQSTIPASDYNLFSKCMPRLIGIAKAIGLVPDGADIMGVKNNLSGLVDDSDDVWVDIMETYSLDTDADLDNPKHVALLCKYARAILTQSIAMADTLIDFDDQLYMPVIVGTRFWQNDVIFVDEAQDLNKIQRTMLRRALKTNGRLIAVGDPNQAIYGFRGADHTSIDMIKQEFGAKELPLTISYRCPKAVVQEARQWVSHIQPSPTAATGSVSHLQKYDAKVFTPTDIIVCRNTKPLIAMAFELLRDGVPCKVRGRDIGAGLVSLIKKFKTPSLGAFLEAFDRHVAKKTADYIAKGKDDLAGRLQDQYDTIAIFADSLDPDAMVVDLIARIESMFTDNGPSILALSTIHKAKGLEFPRVYILDPDLMPSKYARTPGAKQQERNLQYVAVTRAQADVIYINTKGYKSGKGR